MQPLRGMSLLPAPTHEGHGVTVTAPADSAGAGAIAGAIQHQHHCYRTHDLKNGLVTCSIGITSNWVLLSCHVLGAEMLD